MKIPSSHIFMFAKVGRGHTVFQAIRPGAAGFQKNVDFAKEKLGGLP